MRIVPWLLAFLVVAAAQPARAVIPPSAYRFAVPAGQPPGHIYVSDDAGGAVFRYLLGTNGDPVGPPDLVIGGFKSPRGLAVDKAGNLYVTDAGANTLGVFAPNATTPFYTLKLKNVHPNAVAVDGDGYVYLAAYFCCRLGSYHSGILLYPPVRSHPTKPMTSTAFGASMINALDWLRGADGGAMFYTALPGGGYTWAHGRQLQYFGEQFCGAIASAGVAVGPAGTVFVTDRNSNAIYAYPQTFSESCGPYYTIGATNIPLAFSKAGAAAVDASYLYVASGRYMTNGGRKHPPGIVVFPADTNGYISAYEFTDPTHLKEPRGIALGP